MVEGKKGNYLVQLDGLRALSVAAVAWSHWRAYWNPRPALFPGAELGVETFFVISGFLITGILLDNRSEILRSLVLKQFYARRFLRIFPLFYLAIVVALLLHANGLAESWYWHVSYLSNIYFYLWGWHGSLSHFWSLAVEEQFYLFWPLFILLIPGRFLTIGIVATVVAAPFYAMSMNAWHPGFLGVMKSGILMPSCMSSLGIGACLARLVRQSASPRRIMWWMLGLGLLGSIAWHCCGSPDWLQPFDRLAGDCVLGWLVYSAGVGFRGPLGWFLVCPPVNYLGRISYGLYIIHNFAKPLAENFILLVGHPKWLVDSFQIPFIRVLIFMLITIGLASLSWHLFEKPINNLKRHFPYPLKQTDGIR
jgi:peptidoglycan/LPS O-acetylase OafA/YrhL